ncbi:hypothetical protein D7X30_29105 [Corallococcus sp. AB011P]|uniref:hypothetical protein n=1 Tax=Corallococcus sp. AB011P TaxID=2316735 RepID=UPI000EA3C000|nr:hypothetical protein [Corallococcus sp. AB011P]RKG54051.1 hypothetical protein D7X30_29105 [Corallococcus sp. AB011P]
MRVQATLAAIAAALAVPAHATAQELLKVKFGPAGPISPLPITKTFYLEGEVPASVMEVWPVFVRYRRSPFAAPALEFHEADNCQQVSEALILDDNPDTTLLGKRRGRIGVNELWNDNSGNTVYEDLRIDHGAYVPGGWTRPKEDEGKQSTFSVLVSAPEFFVDGADYCLFVYHKKTEIRDDAITVRKLVIGYLDAVEAVRNGAPASCSAPDGKALPEEECLVRALKEQLHLARNEEELLGYVKGTLVNAATHLRYAPGDIVAELNAWPGLLAAHSHAQGWRPSSQFLSIDTDPLAHAIAETLVAQGKELAWNGNTYLYKKLKVTHLRLRADFKGLTLASSAKPQSVDDFADVDLDLETIPALGTKLTLRDVLEYGAARLRVGNGFEDAFAAAKLVEKHVGLIAQAQGDQALQLKSSDETFAAGLQARLQALADFEQRAHQLCVAAAAFPRKPLLGGTEQEVLASLGQWISTQVLKDPPDSKYQDRACPPRADDPRKWPERYRTAPSHGLRRAVERLQEYISAAKMWRDAERDSVAKIAESRISPPIVSTTANAPLSQLSQSSYVEEYITPIVGYGLLPAENVESISRVTVGIELTAYPNSVNSPMWSNGSSDWGRAFALQLGILASPFGPQKRLSAPPDLPVPFFAALAFHPAPYVSVSYGAAFVGERRSTLTQEQPRWLVTHLFSLSLQANIPGLLAGRTPTAVPVK